MNSCNDKSLEIWLFPVGLLPFWKWSIFQISTPLFPRESASVIIRVCLHVWKKLLTLEFVSCRRWITFRRSGTISCSLHKAEERGKTSSQSSSTILLKATSTDLLLLREKRRKPVSWREREAAFTVYLPTCLVQRRRKGPTCKFSNQFGEKWHTREW